MAQESWPLALRVERGKLRELGRALHASEEPYQTDDVDGDPLPAPPTFPSAVMNHWGRPVADVLVELGCDLGRVLHGDEEFEYPDGPIREGQTLRGKIRLLSEEHKSSSRDEPLRLLRLEIVLRDDAGGPGVRVRRTIIEKL